MKYLLLSVLIVLTYCQNCEEEIDFDHSKCKFYLHYDNNSCFDFSFIRCQWEQCTSSIYINGTPYCLHRTTFNDSSWSGCTNRCCDGDVDYPQTYSSITQCQDYINAHFKLMMIILGSVLGGTLLIICIVVCYRCLRNRVEQDPNSPPASELSEMTNISLQSNWRFESLTNSKPNVCIICMGNQPSLQLQCGHFFHRLCILTWLKKKYRCSICRSSEIDKINVYCQQCFSAYIETTLEKFREFSKSKKQIFCGCQLR